MKKKSRRDVRPREGSADKQGRCTCSVYDPPYLVLHKLLWRRCPRCEAVSPTALSAPFYRRAG
jgi:hypothetical protein